MPKLPQELSKTIDDPITIKEIQCAFGSTKPGKAPGPDGNIAYYKTFISPLCKFMHKFFNALSFTTAFPRDILSAHIAVIPKERTPHRVAVIGRSRYSTHTSKFSQSSLPPDSNTICHPWTPGPSRLCTNSQGLLHIVNGSNTPCVFLGTDAEKEFDRVNWQFMASVLKTCRARGHHVSLAKFFVLDSFSSSQGQWRAF